MGTREASSESIEISMTHRGTGEGTLDTATENSITYLREGLPSVVGSSSGSFGYSPSPQPSHATAHLRPIKGEGALSLLHWREKARMRGKDM